LANYPGQPASREDLLEALQRDAFGYFLHETNPANGLVADKTQTDSPATPANRSPRRMPPSGSAQS
jgi:hypothetical protein